MALPSTIHSLEIALSDVDRGVYEQLELKVARHPSESLDYLVTRVLAYCLEYAPGIAFSKGVGEGDEPAIWIHDLTGKLEAWIEVGAPEAARVHKARKACSRVAIYPTRGIEPYRSKLAAEKIYKAEEIPVYEIERAFVDALGKAFDRRTVLDLSVTDRHLYATVGGKTLTGVVTEHRIREVA